MPRVLCADDDSLIRDLLERTLASGGHDVVMAADGAEAIGLLDSGAAFDALVTDHSMPGASGVDVIEHAARVDPTMPSIIVTAYHDLDLAIRAMHAGAVGFLPKPFRPDHLLTVVESALERRRLAADAMRLNLVVPMLERFTMLLANTLETKDCQTNRHSERLVGSSDAVAAVLGLDADERFSVRIGACLHDVGKVGVPEALLRKPGPLSADEQAIMRLHPDIGAAILEDIDTWSDVRQIVRHHHEWWDGSGYPLGLARTDIPLGARIVSVVDAFDVMTNDRPYAPARPVDFAVRELQQQSGTQFDPDAVEAFVEILGAAPAYDEPVDSIRELDVVSRRAEAGVGAGDRVAEAAL